MEFEYYVPEIYATPSAETIQLDQFFKDDRFRDNINMSNSSATILFHLSDIIPTPTSSKNVNVGIPDSIEESNPLKDGSNTETMHETRSSTGGEQSSSFGLRGNKHLEELQQILRDNGQICIDVVDENFNGGLVDKNGNETFLQR